VAPNSPHSGGTVQSQILHHFQYGLQRVRVFSLVQINVSDLNARHSRITFVPNRTHMKHKNYLFSSLIVNHLSYETKK
jgi:hypothetical protein